MKNSRKNILGLNTVKAFIVILLAISIIGVITLIVLGIMTSDTIVSQTGPIVEGARVNESLTSVTETGESLNVSDEVDSSCVSRTIFNATDGVEQSNTDNANFTFSNRGCTVSSVVTGTANNTNLVVNYTFYYRDRSDLKSISDNTSDGLVSFFGNATTFFALLAVVVIILIISLVVVVVNRFGSPSGAQGTQATPSL